MAKKITKPACGFTLIEVLITLTLLATLLSIAIGDISLFNATKLVKSRDDFLFAISLTRNLAISRNRPVSLCKSGNITKCESIGGFEQGWIIFEDLDKDGKYDNGERKLKVVNADMQQITIRGNNNFKNRITYLPSGDSTAFGRFVLCDKKRLKTSEAIFVNASGKPRTAPDNNKNTIPEDNNNKDIKSCLTDTTILD